MDTAQVRKYLERVFPWDGTHYINTQRKDPRGRGFRGYPHLTVESALRDINNNKQKHDVYMAMGSYVATKELLDGRGKRYEVADREKNNLYAHKALWIDLDVKGTGYPDTRSAIRALMEFCKAISLPEPNVIVLSGTGGAHCYWTLDCTLSVVDWKARAVALCNALIAHGVKFDSQCTADSVRILRVPETFNAKQTPYLPVTMKRCEPDYTLAEIDGPLAPYFGKAVAPTSQSSEPDENDELSGGIVLGKAAKRRAEDVALVCPLFKQSLETHGEHDSEPVWFAMLGISHYCEESDKIAHDVSSSHPGYLYEETEQERKRLADDRERNPSIGWSSCASIALMTGAAAVCGSCPNMTLGKSPLALTSPPAPPVTPEALPVGYNRHPQTKFIWKQAGIVDGKQEPAECILKYDIFDAWMSPGEWALHFKYNTGGAGVQEVVLPGADAQSEQISKTLGRQGMMIDNSMKVRKFMISFMQQLQSAKDTVANAQAFGWYDKDGVIDGFIYGGIRYTPKGPGRAVRGPINLASIYTPTGNIDPWKKAVSLINKQMRPSVDVIIATAFAAPLVPFTGLDGGFAVGAWEPGGGAGKSTALNLATAVWGHPQTGKMGLNDTEAAFHGRAATLRNLPLCWDEVKLPQQEKFAKILFEVTSGKSRNRARRDGSPAESFSVQTCVTYTLNIPMIDKVREVERSTTASEMRIFEYRTPPMEKNPENLAVGDALKPLMVDLRNNYGRAGEIYAQFLGENAEMVKQEVEQTVRILTGRLQHNYDERFWVAAVATILLGAKYANKLGLTEIDIPNLKAFLFEEFVKLQDHKKTAPNDFAKAENIVTVLADFLREKRAENTVFTDKILLGRGKPGKDAVKLVSDGPESTRIKAVQVHVAVDQKIIRFGDAPFGEWLKKKEISKATILEAMQRLLSARRITGGVLGGGTRFAQTGFKEPLWELAVTGTPLDEHIEWEV